MTSAMTMFWLAVSPYKTVSVATCIITEKGETEMQERWDCIFVERIDSTGQIYLTRPLKYGYMYKSREGAPSEVRKSVPKECGEIAGLSDENKILLATAIATALNRNKIKSSGGLIVRGFSGKTPFFGLQTALIKTQGKSLRTEGTTVWLIYVSPTEEFHHVEGRHFGDKLSPENYLKIFSCIKSIEDNW